MSLFYYVSANRNIVSTEKQSLIVCRLRVSPVLFVCCCVFICNVSFNTNSMNATKLVINDKAKDKLNALSLSSVIGHIKATYNYMFPIKQPAMTKRINKCKVLLLQQFVQFVLLLATHRLVQLKLVYLLGGGAVVIDILLLFQPVIRPHIDSRTHYTHTFTDRGKHTHTHLANDAQI